MNSHRCTRRSRSMASRPSSELKATNWCRKTTNSNPEAQAGSHPFQLSTTFNLNQTFTLDPDSPIGKLPSAPAIQRNLAFKLPPGLLGNANVVGNPNAVQQCADVAFGAGDAKNINSCPENTVIGVAAVTFNDPILSQSRRVVPVFNLVPAPGEPARFGFESCTFPSSSTPRCAPAKTTARPSPSKRLPNRPGSGQQGDVLGHAGRSAATTPPWLGMPRPRRLGRRLQPEKPCETLGIAKPAPFLLLPTSCGPLDDRRRRSLERGELEARRSRTFSQVREPPGRRLTGCEGLPFEPDDRRHPRKAIGEHAHGHGSEVKMPQDTTLSAEAGGKAEADIESTTLELPEGLAGERRRGKRAGNVLGRRGRLTGGPEAPDTRRTRRRARTNRHFTPAGASCPNAAKIGTVDIKTPLLEKEVKGSVYLGAQDTNPFASPLVLYIVAEEETSKVLVKLAGEVRDQPQTGSSYRSSRTRRRPRSKR